MNLLSFYLCSEEKVFFWKSQNSCNSIFLPTWTRLFSSHDSNYIGICHVPLWIKRVVNIDLIITLETVLTLCAFVVWFLHLYYDSMRYMGNSHQNHSVVPSVMFSLLPYNLVVLHALLWLKSLQNQVEHLQNTNTACQVAFI